jgi:hypothetical protein
MCISSDIQFGYWREGARVEAYIRSHLFDCTLSPFGDQAQFSRQFRQHYGLTPSDFVRQRGLN